MYTIMLALSTFVKCPESVGWRERILDFGAHKREGLLPWGSIVHSQRGEYVSKVEADGLNTDTNFARCPVNPSIRKNRDQFLCVLFFEFFCGIFCVIWLFDGASWCCASVKVSCRVLTEEAACPELVSMTSDYPDSRYAMQIEGHVHLEHSFVRWRPHHEMLAFERFFVVTCTVVRTSGWPQERLEA
jgi:hypothetical protein